MKSHLRTRFHTLSNGIPVILQPYDGTVAANYWWVKTGSGDETAPEAGFAHFLEHMLFKDAAAKETGKASTGKMALAIESLGGDINAYTSFDQTVYHVTCAATHWEKVLESFSSIAKPQRFLKEDFEREREVILEEWKKNHDSPGRQLFQALFSSTFKKHPYGRPVIGYPKTLKAATVSKLEAFYQRRYAAARMGLILVGPVGEKGGAREKRILSLLEKKFGSQVLKKPSVTKKPKKEPSTRPSEPELRKTVETRLVPFDVKTPTVALSFRAPGILHEDIPALDLLCGILGAGELGRVYQELFYKKSLVTSAGGGLYSLPDNGMIYFQADFEELSKLPEVVSTMIDELVRIRREGPTAEELERVRIAAESEKLYSTQTADGVAGRLGFLNFVANDSHYDERFLEELRLVDADAVKAMAEKYFDERRMSLVVMYPEKASKPDLKPILKNIQSALGVKKPQPKAKRAPVLLTQVGRPVFLERESGLKIIHLERGQSNVIAVHAAGLGGLRLELAHPVRDASRDWGASHLMAGTWSKGTPTRDAMAIAREIEGRAAGMDGFGGRNTVGLQMSGLARDWDALSAVFTDVLIHPIFPQSEVKHSQRVTEDSLRSLEDHSAQLCSQLFLETLYESHPYGKITLGSLESVPGIDSATLSAFHRHWVRPENFVLTVVGNASSAQINDWVSGLEEQWSKVLKVSGAPGEDTRKLVVPVEADLKAPRWVEKKLDREQAHILVGGLGLTMTDPDRMALMILQNVLGGQSGRLFIELREKKSLAYTVAPVHMEGLERGYVGTYIACSTAKKKEAIDGMRIVLEKLAEKGPTSGEMKRAKEFFLGHRAMDLQSDFSIATHLGLEHLYGLPYRTEEELVQLVRAISPQQIQKVCQKYFVEAPQVTSIVG